MSRMLEVCDALGSLISEATASTCHVDVPEQISAGDVCLSIADLETDGELNESGGESDQSSVLKCFDCQGVTGGSAREVFDLVSDHLERLKTLIESDVTLGGRVQQVRISKIDQWTAASSDNSYECFAEVSLEVRKW
jgi:hypothetical protein